MRGLVRIGLFLAVFGCLAAPALADDLKGNWRFDTSKFEGDCVIKGTMTFTPTKTANAYTCVFISEQICAPDNPNFQYIKVKQTCTATKIGSQVAVKSAVDHVIERRPKIPNPEEHYFADNFIVTLSKSLTEMRGGHYDEQRQLKAHFWREVELVS